MTHELWRDTRVSGYGHGYDGQAEPWANLRQAVRVRITRERIEHPEKPLIAEDHYYLTSLSAAVFLGTALVLLRLIRAHWEIENQLHHVKDRSQREDAQTTRRGASMLARLRSLAVGLQRFITGDWTSQREDVVQNDPCRAVSLLTRRRFPRKALLLL